MLCGAALVALALSSFAAFPAGAEQTAQNGIWAGYVNLHETGSFVGARIDLPAFTCTGYEKDSMWVGFDGYNTTTDVVQDGLSVNCASAGSTPTWSPWYEFYKSGLQWGTVGEVDLTSPMKNLAGDHLNLGVSYFKAGVSAGDYFGQPKVIFSLQLETAANKTVWSDTISKNEPLGSDASFTQAECVFEQKSADVMSFGGVEFENCTPAADATSANLIGLYLVADGRLVSPGALQYRANGENYFTVENLSASAGNTGTVPPITTAPTPTPTPQPQPAPTTQPPPAPNPIPQAQTFPEATGYGPVHIFSSTSGPSGEANSELSANTVVSVSCYTTGTAEGPGQDPYWYLIAGTNDYGSADAFCDEGATTCPNGFAGTPAIDPNVPRCG